MAALLLERYEGRAAALESQLRASQEEAAGWREEAEARGSEARSLKAQLREAEEEAAAWKTRAEESADEAASLQAKVEELQVRGGVLWGPTTYSGDPPHTLGTRYVRRSRRTRGRVQRIPCDPSC